MHLFCSPNQDQVFSSIPQQEMFHIWVLLSFKYLCLYLFSVRISDSLMGLIYSVLGFKFTNRLLGLHGVWFIISHNFFVWWWFWLFILIWVWISEWVWFIISHHFSVHFRLIVVLALYWMITAGYFSFGVEFLSGFDL